MIKHFTVYLWICIVNFVVVFALRASPTKSLEVLSRTHEDSEGDCWLSGMILLFFWLCEDVFALSSDDQENIACVQRFQANTFMICCIEALLWSPAF